MRLDAEAPEPRVCFGWQGHLRKFSHAASAASLGGNLRPLRAGAVEKI
jgi:hypothetical protein